MAIPASATVKAPVAPTARVPFVEAETRLPTRTAQQFMQQLYDYVNSTSRVIPVNASNAGNVVTLTLLNVAPQLDQYNDYEIFAFVATATSTGAVTAKVVTNSATLNTIKVYKNSGAAQAGAGDVVLNSLYLAVYNSALDSGNGGLVLK